RGSFLRFALPAAQRYAISRPKRVSLTLAQWFIPLPRMTDADAAQRITSEMSRFAINPALARRT
ncbi:TPA: hypothetical protein ACU917_001794, partial [Klebsiella michiganensis]